MLLAELIVFAWDLYKTGDCTFCTTDAVSTTITTMRGNGNRYSTAPSRSSTNPYSDNLFNENIDDDDGIPQLPLKILGPFAPILLSDDHSNPEKLQDRLRLFALSVLSTSIFFWVWAMYNTYHLRNSSGGFDLGVLSFFGSGISSALLLRSALGGKCYDRDRRFGCGRKKDKYDDELDMYGIKKTRRRDDVAPNHSPPSTYLRAFMVLTQLTVVANYMLGILFSFTAGSRVYVYFATYCIIFSILWLVVAFAGWTLVTVYREAVRRAYGEEVLDGPPRRHISIWRSILIALTNRFIGQEAAMNDRYYEDDEDEIDDELRALYEGRGGYTNRR